MRRGEINITDRNLLKSGHIQKLVLKNGVCHLHSSIYTAVSVLSQQKQSVGGTLECNFFKKFTKIPYKATVTESFISNVKYFVPEILLNEAPPRACHGNLEKRILEKLFSEHL